MIRTGDQVRIRDNAGTATASVRPYAGQRGRVREIGSGKYGANFLVVLNGDRSVTAFNERDLLRHHDRKI